MREDQDLELIDLGPASAVTQGWEEPEAEEDLVIRDYRD